MNDSDTPLHGGSSARSVCEGRLATRSRTSEFGPLHGVSSGVLTPTDSRAAQGVSTRELGSEQNTRGCGIVAEQATFHPGHAGAGIARTRVAADSERALRAEAARQP